MATKVSLRSKSISGNRKSLYLDFYPAISNPETGKKTRREFLGIYLHANPKVVIDKQSNKESEALAENILAKRRLQLQSEDFGFFKKKEIDFKENFKGIIETKTGSNMETQYFLQGIFRGEFRRTSVFHHFSCNNYFIITNRNLGNVKVYTAELSFILTSKELKAVKQEGKVYPEAQIISGQDYIQFYREGYLEGEKYFDSNHSIELNSLYGEKAKAYVSCLHHNYFHNKVKTRTGYKEGWHWVKTTYPNNLSETIIKEYGYFSGIVSRVEELEKEYPKLFESFRKCERPKS